MELRTEVRYTLVNSRTGVGKTVVLGHNLIVFGFSTLVASLLKGDPTYGLPLSWWAVGSGEGQSWDILTPEERENKSQYDLTVLYNEVARVPVSVVYIDENDQVVTPGPTHRIEVRGSFGPDTIGPVREFGIFGGDATAARNSGIMIDHKTYAVINVNTTPGEDNVLIWAVRITC